MPVVDGINIRLQITDWKITDWGIYKIIDMKIYVFLLFLVAGQVLFGQVSAGKIVFERKTNLDKKFTDPRSRKMMGFTDENKVKVELFDLYFNDTCSIFKPIISDEADPLSWATTKNTVYQNFNTEQKLSVLNLMGQLVYVTDSITPKTWKVTESTRYIAGYNCYKAIWQKDDSTRIYAWFSVDLVPTVGPEGFSGLPGAILGLATEDGGIIYFAKSVELIEPAKEVFTIEVKKKDQYTSHELKTKIEKEMGDNPMGRRMVVDLFRWL